jgi:hypothetical protein
VRRIWLAVCAVAALFAAPKARADEVPPSDPAVSDTDLVDAMTPVDDGELDQQRGGFAVEGMNITLGADIRTYLNGDLALHTVVNWTETGAHSTQTASAALTPAAARDLAAGALAGGRISMTVGGSTVYLANEGQTALVQRTDGGIQNMVFNTASNQAISQHVDATLNLQGYDGFRADILSGRIAESLGSALSGAMIGATGP